MRSDRKAVVKILALQRESHVAPGMSSLSVAARVTEVLDYLEACGRVEYASIAENDPCAERGVEWADILVLSKHNSSQALRLALFAKSKGVGVIYDIDDWIFSFPEYSGGKAKNDSGFSREIINIADWVTVANDVLLKKIGSVMPEIAPTLLPNGMWVEKYCSTPDISVDEATPPRIVFTNADFLKMQHGKEMLLCALQVFFIRHPDYILDFFGDPFPEMFSLPFMHFTNRIPYSDYMHSLVAGGYQFAITPLGGEEDSAAADFNACKNPFKYLNYGTAMVPGIYSNAVIYKNCIQPGETGLLIENEFDTWCEALEQMAGDQSLRTKIRATAYEDVRTNFHISKSAEALSKIIEQLI